MPRAARTPRAGSAGAPRRTTSPRRSRSAGRRSSPSRRRRGRAGRRRRRAARRAAPGSRAPRRRRRTRRDRGARRSRPEGRPRDDSALRRGRRRSGRRARPPARRSDPVAPASRPDCGCVAARPPRGDSGRGRGAYARRAAPRSLRAASTSAAAPSARPGRASSLIPSVPSSTLAIRSWKTAMIAAPAPRKTSAIASVSERRDGDRGRGRVHDRRHLVRRPRLRRSRSPSSPWSSARRRRPAGGSQTRQTATQMSTAASGIRTSGTKFAPAQPSFWV